MNLLVLLALVLCVPSEVLGCGGYGEPCDVLDPDFPCCYSENECVDGFCGGCKIGVEWTCGDDLSTAQCCYACYEGRCASEMDRSIDEDYEVEFE